MTVLGLLCECDEEPHGIVRIARAQLRRYVVSDLIADFDGILKTMILRFWWCSVLLGTVVVMA